MPPPKADVPPAERAPAVPDESAEVQPQVDFYLEPEEDIEQEQKPVQPPSPSEESTAKIEVEDEALPAGEERPQDEEPAEDLAPPPREDPLLRMTLLHIEERGDMIPAAPAEQDEGPDLLDAAMEDLQRKPLRGTKRQPEPEDEAQAEETDETEEAADSYAEPSFIRQGRRRQRLGRTMRLTMSIGSVLLLFVLLAQGTYVYRDQIAARFPTVKPALQAMCDRIDCVVGLPQQIDAVAIESSELQTVSPDSQTLTLTVLLRNLSDVAQAWPHLELTLNDNGERPVVRRAFAPSEYLPEGVNPRPGFPARSEQPVRLFLEPDAVKASGYRVYLFYP